MQPQIGKMIGASSISRSKSDFKAADLMKMGRILNGGRLKQDKRVWEKIKRRLFHQRGQ